jgi:hypothetical protein
VIGEVTTAAARPAGRQPEAPASEQVAAYPLLRALIERRSRRFGTGMRLNGGPLRYDSASRPEPLTLEEEAALAFAACGITGSMMGEFAYQTGDVPEASTGNCMMNFVGRTIGSADAVHCVCVFVINDDGVWLLRRPQDFPRTDVAGLVRLAREHRLVELYERSRVRISDRRAVVPRESQVVMPFNKWAANLPGTTYFLPVNELTALYMNILLIVFHEEVASMMVDDRNRFQPAGLKRFGRTRGGYLYDDFRMGRYLIPVSYIETMVHEFAAVEQGMVLQNLALMAEALGLGGYPHFAAHHYMWPQQLGFRMEVLPFTRTFAVGPVLRGLIRLLGQEQPMPTAVGLERDGEVLIKPFAPPYYPTMSDAVQAFVDYKFAPGGGTFRDGGAATAWRDGAAVQAGVPRYTEQSVAATKAFCEYVYRRYGRFPFSTGPFETVLAFQASHLDPAFYDRFYRDDALPARHRHRHA